MKANSDNLKKIISKKTSSVLKESDYRLNNRWLRYSSNIARRIIAVIEDNESLTQAVLAKEVGVSSQYISKVIKGKQNLSLETIGKISDALGVELISFPPYKYSQLLTPNGVVKFSEIKDTSEKRCEILIDDKIFNIPLNAISANNVVFYAYGEKNKLHISQDYVEKLPELGDSNLLAKNS